MTVRGYQTWLTVDKTIVCLAICPFTIGLGIRHETKRQVGIFDIVLMGFGISVEWDRKIKPPNKLASTGAA